MATVKTNSKVFNQFAYQYILDAINSDYVQLNSTQEKLDFLALRFKDEYCNEYNCKQYPNTQQRFKEWLQGLPSCINIDYENYRIIELAKQWQSLPEDATDKQEDAVLNNWFNLIAFKCMQLFTKFNINIHSK